jgi:hypothetical protein
MDIHFYFLNKYLGMELLGPKVDVYLILFKIAHFYEHMIKARAHKGGVRIGKTPKKLASICCP